MDLPEIDQRPISTPTARQRPRVVPGQGRVIGTGLTDGVRTATSGTWNRVDGVRKETSRHRHSSGPYRRRYRLSNGTPGRRYVTPVRPQLRPTLPQRHSRTACTRPTDNSVQFTLNSAAALTEGDMSSPSVYKLCPSNSVNVATTFTTTNAATLIRCPRCSQLGYYHSPASIIVYVLKRISRRTKKPCRSVRISASNDCLKHNDQSVSSHVYGACTPITSRPKVGHKTCVNGQVYG